MKNIGTIREFLADIYKARNEAVRAVNKRDLDLLQRKLELIIAWAQLGLRYVEEQRTEEQRKRAG